MLNLNHKIREGTVRLVLSCLSCLMILAVLPAVAFAGQVSLTWNAPTTNADGTPISYFAGAYRIYYGTSTGNYNKTINHTNTNNEVTYLVTNLTDNKVYYFVVTAVNTLGNESAYSNEVSKSSPTADTEAPKIMSFIMSKKATSLEVLITAFMATDNVGVTGYKLTETLGSTDGEWSATPQNSYTFSSAGKKVLYAYVRDAAGNISKARKAKVEITLTLMSQASVGQVPVQQISAYDPAVSPLVSTDLTIAKPVAVGSVAEGGDMRTLQVVLGNLTLPVDAYLTLYSPSEGGEPVHAYTLNAENQFEPLVGAKQVWRSGVTSIQEVISETPVNELLPGKYLIVFEIRTEGSTEVMFTWMTSFMIQ